MNVYAPFLQRAREAPGAEAVLAREGTLARGELARAVAWTAASFRRAGVAPRDTVAISLDDQVQYLVASMALACLGAGQLALQQGDPPRVRRELARLAGVTATVCEAGCEAHGGRLEPPPAALGELKALAAPALEAAGDATLPFLIKRTSGTTRAAFKLLVMTHAMRGPTYEHLPYELPAGGAPRVLHASHVSFLTTMSNVPRILGAGGCVVFSAAADTAPGIVELVDRARVSVMYAGPVHAARLLRAAREDGLLLPGVRVFNVSSTMVPEDLRQAIRERLTPNLQVRYNTTETGAISATAPGAARAPGSVGRPLAGVALEIVDDEGHALPPGVRGTPRIRTPWMSLAYLGEPEETQRAFRGGWFHVADLVERTPEGELLHHGRTDDMMIVDGINVSAAEIEQAMRRHPAVAEAAAFAVASAARGSVPAVAVVLRSPVPGSELLAHGAQWLGARRPRNVMIVTALPRSPAGKLLRRELLLRFEYAAKSARHTMHRTEE